MSFKTIRSWYIYQEIYRFKITTQFTVQSSGVHGWRVMKTESRKKFQNRHAGLDPASRINWSYWIPAFAGMTS